MYEIESDAPNSRAQSRLASRRRSVRDVRGWQPSPLDSPDHGAVHGARRLRQVPAMQCESLPVADDCPCGPTGLLRPRAILADAQKLYLRARMTSHLSHLIPLSPGESHSSQLNPGESRLSHLILPRIVVVRRRPTRPTPVRRGSCPRAAGGGWARRRGRTRRRSRSPGTCGSSPARPAACSRRGRRSAAWPSLG